MLDTDFVEEQCWIPPNSSPAVLLVDARGVPARCGAVLFIDGRILYTDGKPADAIVRWFEARDDNQITSLEILAIAVGPSTFSQELAGRTVVVYSDNKGAEGSVRKGASAAWDHSQLIHEIWTLAWSYKMHLWVERVASEDNISDLPSREEYTLLRDIAAEWISPKVAQVFLQGAA